MSIENQIQEFILHNLYFADNQSLDYHASFLETGIVDSMGVMELVAFIESAFGVTTLPQEIVVEHFDSVAKLADFVRRKLSLANPEAEAKDVPAPTVSSARP
ncbi:MAG: acyl carrier protein [Verrucomicrobia bacterium]|nr:acyl carrier protein [Verrucomicrobiota bacterium]